MQNTIISVVPLHGIENLYCIRKYIHQFQEVLPMKSKIWGHLIAQSGLKMS